MSPRVSPREVPAPPRREPPTRLRRADGSASPRVPVARLARAFCGPIQQLRGRKVKLRQRNQMKQNPKDCCALDCTPRATWVGGSGAAGVIIPGLLEGRAAQGGTAASRISEPRPRGPRGPPSNGFSWVGTRRHHATCLSLASGTLSRAPHNEGPGSLFRTSPPTPSADLGLVPPGTPGCAGVGSGVGGRPTEHAPLLLPPQEIKWEL